MSSDIVRSIERSTKQVTKIPSLEHLKIKEKILENFIDGINTNKKINSPS
ncbi:MAG: hypothetical protein R3255_01350 [Candidatus Lokiarchaeia archaeon]|nr:hypothetical protein [Candidatus Lokiarchaeia archaeon]